MELKGDYLQPYDAVMTAREWKLIKQLVETVYVIAYTKDVENTIIEISGMVPPLQHIQRRFIFYVFGNVLK